MSENIPGSLPHPVRASISGRTDTGPVRAQNQDAIMIAGVVSAQSGTNLRWQGQIPDSGLTVAVVDGMGGHAGGGDAAALAATALAGLAPNQPAENWDACFEQISLRISQAGQAWGTPAMGATAALLAITNTGLVLTNIGDCRIYRASGRHLGQLSIDDRTDDPESNLVTQALGGSARLDAHLWQQPLLGTRERYLLCSDGVWGSLDPVVLRDLCLADREPDLIVDAISEACQAQQAQDNCSIIVVDLFQAPDPPLEQTAGSARIQIVPASEGWHDL